MDSGITTGGGDFLGGGLGGGGLIGGLILGTLLRNNGNFFGGGDGAAAVLLEPTFEELGVIDHINRVDGSGSSFLQIKSGGSLRPASYETIDNDEHFIHLMQNTWNLQ